MGRFVFEGERGGGKRGDLVILKIYIHFSFEQTQMDYDHIATTVFTPREYGVIGLSEEVALERYGEKDIEVYHVHWKPLQWCLDSEREGPFPYCKIICVKSGLSLLPTFPFQLFLFLPFLTVPFSSKN